MKITREDIEKAMRELKGEIQHLRVESESSFKSNPTQVANPFVTRIVGGG